MNIALIDIIWCCENVNLFFNYQLFSVKGDTKNILQMTFVCPWPMYSDYYVGK